jgi:hypothetical protein
MTIPERRIAIAVTTNVSGSENTSLLAARLADVFVRGRQGRGEGNGGDDRAQLEAAGGSHGEQGRD